MLQECKSKTNWFVGTGFLLEVVWMYTGIAILGLGGAALFVAGCCFYAKGKGHHPAWGLLGLLSLVGLIVLIFLPDKRKDAEGAGSGATPSAGRIVCPRCKAVLEPEGEIGQAPVPCPVCGQEFVPSTEAPKFKVVSENRSSKKWVVFGGLAVVALLFLFVACPPAFVDDDGSETGEEPGRQQITGEKHIPTVDELRTQMVDEFNQMLSNPADEMRKRIERAHVTVTVKSAYVVRCDLTTLDGTNLAGNDGENIRSLNMLLRFEWQGILENGFTDIRFFYDAVNKRGTTDLEYTTAAVNTEDPAFWYDLGTLIGSCISDGQ